MSNLNGVIIGKGQIGVNTLTSGDGISGLIIPQTAQPSALFLENGVRTFYTSADVKKAGYTETYDFANNTSVSRHLMEFYRMGNEGKKLYVLMVPDITTMQDIIENPNMAKKLLIYAKGEIKQLGICGKTTGEIVYVDGLPTDVFASIPKAQSLYDWSYANHFPCNILLEGYAYKGPAASVADLRAIENVNADKVSIVIGQDFKRASTKTLLAKKYAEVGTALGTLAKATVEQNIGDNEAFNLTDAKKGVWLVPGLSSNEANETVFDDLQTLENKGYIFGLNYSGIEGVRWNGDHVCAEIIQDTDGNINEHTIAYGRTHDKAMRLLRTALLPKVKKSYPVDPTTGKLPIGVQKYFKGIGDAVFAGMVRRKEISSGEMFVDPESDLITEKVLKTSYVIVPYGTIGEIRGTSNLKVSL